MKITALTIYFFLLTNFSFSQIKKKDLNGIWKTNTELFSKADTIKFYPNIKDCHQTKWTIEKRKFKTNELNICTEPPRISGIVGKEKIKLRKTDFGQVIEYHQNGILADKFRIVELKEQNSQELKLMRFDKLSEQKVYKYVDSLVFKVLNYNPDSTANNYGVKISDSNPNVKIKIRDGGIGNPEPLVVVNGRPLQNREPLKELLLVETYAIKYLTKEQSASIYGSRAINGVILLLTSEKRFKKIWKKYGR
ncbi:Plug domain-containing protein [Aequorivita marina]|uniref:Plug domain-containing protein n=1 Tax=Aequorivita marina TaxID=3073654 RepID=UPI002874CEC2|nr:Plug domain-containing protein [Aequorivita sp. S2608]MDS1298737.1 Plug domain-containing protein [Aequorivita sp. S2608]